MGASAESSGKTYVEVQKILVPELEQQLKAASARRKIDDGTGGLIPNSGGIIIPPFLMSHPVQEQGAGIPKTGL